VRPPGAALKLEFVYDSAFFLNRTPGPPPFSGMNSTPAASMADRIAERLLATGTERPASKLRTVDSPTLASAASLLCDQSLRPLAESATNWRTRP
jgi:hypothetical protein